MLRVLYSPILTSIHDYYGNTIALTRWAFVGKVMSLLFNMLSSLVIAFLPGSRHLLISWLLSPSAVILETKNGNNVRTLQKYDSIYPSSPFSLVTQACLTLCDTIVH